MKNTLSLDHRSVGILTGMRALFTTLVTTSVALIHVLDDPGRFTSVVRGAEEQISALLNTKEVHIEGIKLLNDEAVRRVLPMSKSVGWWMANQTAISARIAENPWVKSADVGSCRGGLIPKFGCFSVTVQERSPRFLALVDDERWIIGDDGSLIIPATGNAPGMTDETLRALVPLYGLASRAATPAKFQAQLNLARDAITSLERAVELPIDSISFEGKGDISVSFKRLEFPVVFGASAGATAVLEDQGRRLKALLLQIKDRLPEVDKIDLAFSRVGIVKFKPPPAT